MFRSHSRFRCVAALWLLACGMCVVSRGAGAGSEGALRDQIEALTSRIDALIEARWAQDGITPAPLAEDAEFMRRVHLDLCGRIPPASEVRDFLADQSPDKRRQLVERLLASPTYIVHATNVWRSILLPEADAAPEIRFFLPGFEAWLRARLAESRNFKEITEEILTLPLNTGDPQAVNLQTTPSPLAFFQAKNGQPENLAGASARVFLGVRIECAQCHHHPFDSWKREQFWSLAAFFQDARGAAMVANPEGTPAEQNPLRSIRIPDTDKTVAAAFFDGSQPEWGGDPSSRDELAHWIVAEENPYFARAAANRVWASLFGVGLVDPADDFGPNNPASHPELLTDLAAGFRAGGHDFKFLVRAITASRTYQRTSKKTHDSQDTDRTFARMTVRGLTPEQLFDSLAQAVGYQQPFDPEQPLNFNNDPARQEFLETFAAEGRSLAEPQATILQALTLMNGDFTARATNLEQSRTLTAIAEAPFLTTSERIDSLFLATLTRFPRDAERERFRKYIDEGGATQNPQEALGDLFWTLLNTSEFLMNH